MPMSRGAIRERERTSEGRKHHRGVCSRTKHQPKDRGKGSIGQATPPNRLGDPQEKPSTRARGATGEGPRGREGENLGRRQRQREGEEREGKASHGRHAADQQGGPSTKVEGPVRSNLHAITNPLHANKESDEPDRGQGPQSGGRVQRHGSETESRKVEEQRKRAQTGQTRGCTAEREARAMACPGWAARTQLGTGSTQEGQGRVRREGRASGE